MNAFGIFPLGPKLFPKAAALVSEQLLRFTQSRLHLPRGEAISSLGALHSQHTTSVRPLGIRQDKEAGQMKNFSWRYCTLLASPEKSAEI